MQQKNKPGRFGVGDGWVAPLIQEATYGYYAYAHGLIDKHQKREVDRLFGYCELAVKKSGPVASAEADKICNKIEVYTVEISGGVNVYDVRITGEYTFTSIARYLNKPSVCSVHVSLSVGPWEDSSTIVAVILEREEQNLSAHLFLKLFESIPVLIYKGIYDMDCSFMGTDNWLESIHWPEGERFNVLSRSPWQHGNKLLGCFRHAGNLTQVLVNGAGYLVPMDQPESALLMLENFINDAAVFKQNVK